MQLALQEQSDGPSPLDGLSGVQRAAILVVLLGEQATAQLFQHLSKREVAKIAREVADLGPIEPEIAQAVLEEYYLAALDAPVDQGGPEVARKILSQASISEEIVDQLITEPAAAQANDVLGPLLEAPPDVLARALQDEHPQTTALVLLQLPPRRAGLLLSALPEEARSETVLRMANVKTVRDEIIDQVATSLHERLSSAKRGQESQGSIARTATILGSMARAETKTLLEKLEPDHPEQVQELREQLYTFESLMDADDKGMQELMRQVDASRVGLALVGCEEEMISKFLDNLSERASKMLREEMEFLGTPHPKEQAEARKGNPRPGAEARRRGLVDLRRNRGGGRR